MADDIVYLIDCSESMNECEGLRALVGPKLNLVKKTLVELLRNANAFNPDDRVALLSFRGRPLRAPEVKVIMPLQEVVPLITEPRIPIEETSALKAGGSTPIGAALKEALKLLMAEGGRGKGIVLITDGGNNDGEHPGRFIGEALKQNVRIDVVGLGGSVDADVLRALAGKTGGVFKHVSHAQELSHAMIWQRTPMPLVDETAQLRALEEALREELRCLDEVYVRREITAHKYGEERSNLQSQLLNLRQELREKRAQASKELAGFHLEREMFIRQLTELRARLDRKELDEKTYLKAASPIEEKIAWLNREIVVKQKTLTAPS